MSVWDMPLQISEEALERHEQRKKEPLSSGAKFIFLFFGFVSAIIFGVITFLLGSFFGGLVGIIEIPLCIAISGALYFGIHKDYGKYFCIGWGIKFILSLLLFFIVIIITLNAKGMKV